MADKCVALVKGGPYGVRLCGLPKDGACEFRHWGTRAYIHAYPNSLGCEEAHPYEPAAAPMEAQDG